jgi:hypothetical protein
MKYAIAALVLFASIAAVSSAKALTCYTEYNMYTKSYVTTCY